MLRYWPQLRPHSGVIITGRHDLRLLFCDRSILQDRINDGTVLVDKGMCRDGKTGIHEVDINKAVTVGKTLEAAGLINKAGSQRPLTLITKTSIVRCPMHLGSDEFDSFINTVTQAGDMLVFGPVH